MVEIKKYKKKKEWKDHVKVCDRIMYEDRVENNVQVSLFKKRFLAKKANASFTFVIWVSHQYLLVLKSISFSWKSQQKLFSFLKNGKEMYIEWIFDENILAPTFLYI